MASSFSDGDATPRPRPPPIPEIGRTPAEILEAVYDAVTRQLARGGTNAPDRVAAAAAVAVIVQARPSLTADTPSSMNGIAADSASPPPRATVDAGPFASLSYEQCLDFLVSLAKIAHAKGMEIGSDEVMYEDGYYPESQIVPGGHAHAHET